MERAGDLESAGRSEKTNKPVSEERHHSEYFWKLNKTNPAVLYLFLINNIFVLINSNIAYWVWRLAWKYFSPLRRSCSFESHPTEVTIRLERGR